MYRFLLTPRWWGINVFVVLAIPFCVFMGTWQLGRFEDRVQTHEQAEKQPEPGTRAAKPLDSLLPVDTVTSGRPATATGTFADQFLVPGRELDDRTGFYVLDMLRTDGGKALPVVRGWMPGDTGRARANGTVPPAPTGRVTVTGDLQASESATSDGVNSAGGLPGGELGIISAASLVNLVPYDVYDAWVTLPASGIGGADDYGNGMRAVPAAAAQGSGLDLKAFQNLGYTGEWFVFAGFVLFMWVRLLRREAETARDIALGLVPDPAASTDADTAAPNPVPAAAAAAGGTTADAAVAAEAGEPAGASAGTSARNE
ncbi:SURF1 family protein [Streptomyces sp. AM 2-1-1]|uniref:SURF1 family protein n=1 Tax=Streptomyces sp. AM 2-1-1 TaxID=3028709 RepID=UPI0023B9EB1C|nr:SURF1 family protein [Streptomyces sp. AM 2-1-1]WEH40520.1 SURF1 family protein [Streptomyces sp. AM 2-1-1]